MIPSPEVIQRIAILRQKSAAGTITPDELKEGIIFLRETRSAAAVLVKSTTRKAKAPAKSADDLLSELEGL